MGNHHNELQMFRQKVLDQTYSHENTINTIDLNNNSNVMGQTHDHENEVRKLKAKKQIILDESQRTKETCEEEIKNVQQKHEKELEKLEEDFQKHYEELDKSFQRTLNALDERLDLKERMEVHKIEEMCDMHLF